MKFNYRDFYFLKQNTRLTGITNGLLHNIASLDSKMFPINIQNCWNMDLNNIAIDASITSLNMMESTLANPIEWAK